MGTYPKRYGVAEQRCSSRTTLPHFERLGGLPYVIRLNCPHPPDSFSSCFPLLNVLRTPIDLGHVIYSNFEGGGSKIRLVE